MEEDCKEITSVNFQLHEIDVAEIDCTTEQNENPKQQDEQSIWVSTNDEYMVNPKRIKLSSEGLAHQENDNTEESLGKKTNVDLFQNEAYNDAVDFLSTEVKILLGEGANGKKIYGRIVNVKSSADHSNQQCSYLQVQSSNSNVEMESQIIYPSDNFAEYNPCDNNPNNVELIHDNSSKNEECFENRSSDSLLPDSQKYDKIYIGKTTNGKEIYGKVIGFKSADGNEITDESKISAMSGKIKAGLAQIIVSEAISLVASDKPDLMVESNECNNPLSDNGPTVDVEKFHTVNTSEETAVVDNQEVKRELEEVKKILKSLLIHMGSTEDSQNHQLLNRKLRIIKTSNDIDNGNGAYMKEFVFFGQMQGSIDGTGWEFVFQNESEDNQNDFLTIQISVDENSDKYGMNYVIQFSKNTTSPDVPQYKNYDSIENLLKISEIKKIHGKKYYECAICKVHFYGPVHFKRHMKVHCSNSTDPSAVLKCPLCECVFSHDSTRTRHIVKMHREEGTVYAS